MKSQGACGWLQKYFQLIKWWCMWSLGVKVGAVRCRKWEEKGHFLFLMNATSGGSLMHTRGHHGKQLHMFDLTDFYLFFLYQMPFLRQCQRDWFLFVGSNWGAFVFLGEHVNHYTVDPLSLRLLILTYTWMCSWLHCAYDITL